MVDAVEDVIERFVRRARRIAAHSLVKNREAITRWAKGEVSGTINLSGELTITWPLPDDEEIFESLAARLRPLTVKNEPIHYEKVFSALESRARRELREEELKRLESLRRAWRGAEVQGVQVRGYAVQMSNSDRTDVTGMVSDTQLAAAWLYDDLVHASATGAKAEALVFDLRERFSAAVRLFSQLAILTVETLRFVEALRDDDAIVVDEAAWEADVVVGDSEIAHETRAFIAELGTEPPDLRTSPGLPEGWRPFRPTELLRLDPGNRVRAVLLADGAEFDSYVGAVIRRVTAKKPITWDVLIAESVIFKFEFDLDHGKAELLGTETVQTTNDLRLQSVKFLLALQGADSLSFQVQGAELLRMSPTKADADQVRTWAAVAEAMDDIVTIERLTGRILPACEGGFGNGSRVRLRWARRLWEGSVVRTYGRPLRAVVEQGTPDVIIQEEGVLEFGGIEVPVPRTLLRHPRMEGSDEQIDEAGARHILISPPAGERFLAWAPEHAAVPTDRDLEDPAPWALTGIDEATFPL